MMKMYLRLVLALAISGAPLLLGGCVYVKDATARDVHQAGAIPEATGDGIARDVLIYQLAGE